MPFIVNVPGWPSVLKQTTVKVDAVAGNELVAHKRAADDLAEHASRYPAERVAERRRH